MKNINTRFLFAIIAISCLVVAGSFLPASVKAGDSIDNPTEMGEMEFLDYCYDNSENLDTSKCREVPINYKIVAPDNIKNKFYLLRYHHVLPGFPDFPTDQALGLPGMTFEITVKGWDEYLFNPGLNTAYDVYSHFFAVDKSYIDGLQIGDRFFAQVCLTSCAGSDAESYLFDANGAKYSKDSFYANSVSILDPNSLDYRYFKDPLHIEQESFVEKLPTSVTSRDVIYQIVKLDESDNYNRNITVLKNLHKPSPYMMGFLVAQKYKTIAYFNDGSREEKTFSDNGDVIKTEVIAPEQKKSDFPQASLKSYVWGKITGFFKTILSWF